MHFPSQNTPVPNSLHTSTCIKKKKTHSPTDVPFKVSTVEIGTLVHPLHQRRTKNTGLPRSGWTAIGLR